MKLKSAIEAETRLILNGRETLKLMLSVTKAKTDSIRTFQLFYGKCFLKTFWKTNGILEQHSISTDEYLTKHDAVISTTEVEFCVSDV